MKEVLVVLSLLCVAIGIIGCIAQDQNGKWHVALSPEAANSIQSGAEATTSILGILSAFIPGLTAVAGAAAAATGVYKKMKPDLVKNKAVSKHVVESIEALKTEQPELWEQVKGYMAKNTNADIEKVIDNIIALTKQGEQI